MSLRSHHQARLQMQHLVEKKISKRSSQSKKAIIAAYMHMSEILWMRWRIGPYQLQIKHLRWYFTEHIKYHAPGTQYRHWLWVAELTTILGRYDDWEPHLRGPWRKPSGLPFHQRSHKKGRKPKFER